MPWLILGCDIVLVEVFLPWAVLPCPFTKILKYIEYAVEKEYIRVLSKIVFYLHRDGYNFMDPWESLQALLKNLSSAAVRAPFAALAFAFASLAALSTMAQCSRNCENGRERARESERARDREGDKQKEARREGDGGRSKLGATVILTERHGLQQQPGPRPSHRKTGSLRRAEDSVSVDQTS